MDYLLELLKMFLRIQGVSCGPMNTDMLTDPRSLQ